MIPEDFTNTRNAITRYARYLKRWEREFNRMEAAWLKRDYSKPETLIEYNFFERCRNHWQYVRAVVGMSFYEDTKEYNNLSNCLLFVSGKPTDLPGSFKWLADLAKVEAPTWKLEN